MLHMEDFEAGIIFRTLFYREKRVDKLSIHMCSVNGWIGNLIKNLDLRHNILSPRHPVWQPKIQSASMSL